MAHLKDNFPARTDTPLLPKRVTLLKKSSFGGDAYSCSSNEEDMSETSPKSMEDAEEEKSQGIHKFIYLLTSRS